MKILRKPFFNSFLLQDVAAFPTNTKPSKAKILMIHRLLESNPSHAIKCQDVAPIRWALSRPVDKNCECFSRGSLFDRYRGIARSPCTSVVFICDTVKAAHVGAVARALPEHQCQ